LFELKSDFTVENAAIIINVIKQEALDSRATIENKWNCKQDLYLIKDLIEEALRKCPKFPKEDAWLREQEKKKVIRILKDEQ